jgi:methylamine dehydrogenase heavy chain
MFKKNRKPVFFATVIALPMTMCAAAPPPDTVIGDASSTSYSSALPAEQIPHVETLPDTYPDTWIFAHDLNFNSLLDGKIFIVDVAAESRNFKGMIGVGMMGQFQAARARPELYTGQTILSRRTYGERTDLLIIFDKSTLQPVDEIVLPAKRQQMVTQPNSFQLIDDERIGLVMNFTPAASVTVVDIPERSVLSEISLPGCNLVFPTGARGFSTLCADGSMVTYVLNTDGSIEHSERSEQFIDIDMDPIFAKNAQLGGVTFFPSYRGRIQPIDFRGDTPAILDAWQFVPDDLRAEDWRPSGWQVIAASSEELFVVMAPDGEEGSHKDGGSEIWVLDPETHALERRIELPSGGLSITVTRSDPAYLVVTNGNMELDVFNPRSGELLRTVSLGGGAYPFVLYSN